MEYIEFIDLFPHLVELKDRKYLPSFPCCSIDTIDITAS